MYGDALSGERISISRVAGQPPRTATPATVSGGQRTTVQPVIADSNVACPTRKPGTSVSTPIPPPAGGVATGGPAWLARPAAPAR